MSFGPPKNPKENIYKAVLKEDSTHYRIFKHNLDLKVEEIEKRTGMKPHDRVNEQLEEEKERQAKELAAQEQAKQAVSIPKYHFHTSTSVTKVENC